MRFQQPTLISPIMLPPVAIVGRYLSFKIHQTLPRPSNVTVIDCGSEHAIEWSWYHWTAFLNIPFAVLFNLFMIFWYLSLILGWTDNPPDEKPWLCVGGLPFIVISLLALREAILAFKNKSRIVVDASTLKKVHIPFSGSGGVAIPRREIARIVCKWDFMTDDNKKSSLLLSDRYYRSGKSIPLISYTAKNESDHTLFLQGRSKNRATVLWMKQQLEQWLNLSAKEHHGGV